MQRKWNIWPLQNKYVCCFDWICVFMIHTNKYSNFVYCIYVFDTHIQMCVFVLCVYLCYIYNYVCLLFWFHICIYVTSCNLRLGLLESGQCCVLSQGLNWISRQLFIVFPMQIFSLCFLNSMHNFLTFDVQLWLRFFLACFLFNQQNLDLLFVIDESGENAVLHSIWVNYYLFQYKIRGGTKVTHYFE